jgi:hypothetical protein
MGFGVASSVQDWMTTVFLGNKNLENCLLFLRLRELRLHGALLSVPLDIYAFYYLLVTCSI